MIDKLQYITQETEQLSHIDCVREACISGINWIQLRVKNKSEEEYLSLAKEAKTICDLYDVKLIINDNIKIAKQINAHGVHLGKADTNPTKARQFLGKEIIIGATANTIEYIQKLVEMNVDYIGLGPYKTTTTKKNLSPVLGLDGYCDISEQTFEILKNGGFSNNIPPMIAIGGIELEDVAALMDTGVYGIAVSGAITNDFSTIKSFNKLINRELTI
jgi:thiamine-phosphate pyrophosphorylase